MSLTHPPGTIGSSQTKPTAPVSNRTEITPPKCFGTDYYGKWNQTGMTFESMKIDKPEYQFKCANCSFLKNAIWLTIFDFSESNANPFFLEK